MFQILCINKQKWNNQLEGKLLKQWNNLINEITDLSHIQIPRCYPDPGKHPSVYQLRGFCDASQRAYATVIYLRIVHTDGSVKLSLVES